MCACNRHSLARILVPPVRRDAWRDWARTSPARHASFRGGIHHRPDSHQNSPAASAGTSRAFLENPSQRSIRQPGSLGPVVRGHGSSARKLVNQRSGTRRWPTGFCYRCPQRLLALRLELTDPRAALPISTKARALGSTFRGKAAVIESGNSPQLRGLPSCAHAIPQALRAPS